MKKLLLALAVSTLVSVAAASAFDGYVSGYITDNADTDEFALLADSRDIDVTFDWESGDFYVTVFGRDHNELGEFYLNEGETINLTGGGLFYLRVWSTSGYGEWSADWVDTD
ncbi:MAG: hypothetical protein PVH29_11235 [Candidatus Zixiibacteriota bacterium]|jgi:hypothetical protein